MQKKDNGQPEKQHWKGDQTELSSVWLELLGLHPGEKPADRAAPDQRVIPLLEGDPWRKLLEAENFERVDLQKLHLPISEREVEQMLQIMHEQTAQDSNDSKDPKDSGNS
jgi:hypothetical protein